MTRQRYRNHPASLVKSIIVLVLTSVLSWLGFRSFIIPSVALVMLAYLMIAWLRTYITIYDDHAVLERSIIGRKTVTIPFGKVASVNEVHGIFGRMFGWSTLCININSSHNASRPEIAFTFRSEVSAYVASLLRNGVQTDGDGTMREDTYREASSDVASGTEPAYSFGAADAILFGIFGSNTYSLILTTFWGILTAVTTIYGDGANVAAISMMIVSGIVPMIATIIRHGNFKVYRSGTTIRLVHGMVTMYDTSFEISRVNAICIRRTLFARMLGKVCIQAEVVGINAEAKDTTPTVTLMIPEGELAHAMDMLFPEFVTDYPVELQPSSARLPTASRAAVRSCAWIGLAAASAAAFLIGGFGTDEYITYAFLGAAVSVPLLLALHGMLSLRVCRLGTGERMFTTVNGVIDRSTTIMQYSRTQITGYIMTPAPRRANLARARIRLLSSSGGRMVKTAFFPADMLDSISEKAVEMSGDSL